MCVSVCECVYVSVRPHVYGGASSTLKVSPLADSPPSPVPVGSPPWATKSGRVQKDQRLMNVA